MLSSELATLLSGRYVEIRMLPLSFGEFIQAHDDVSKEDAFHKYMKYGGFPFLVEDPGNHRGGLGHDGGAGRECAAGD